MGTQAEISFFERALGFGSDWSVTDIILEESKMEAHIYLGYTPDVYVDKSTGEVFELYDKRPERKWQHLPVLQYSTYIHCSIPRYKDADGKVNSIEVPWSDSHSRHTYLFHDYVVDLLQSTHNQTKAAQLARTTFDVVNSIMHKAVKIGLSRRDLSGSVTSIGLDEKSYQRGHDYVTVMFDHTQDCVLDVCHGRDSESVSRMLNQVLADEDLQKVETVTMDMWEAFMLAGKKVIPQADIIHDKFHVVKYLNEAVDRTRKNESKGEGLLKKAKYVMLKNPKNLSGNQIDHFYQIFEENLLTAQAWALTQQFKDTVLEEKLPIKAAAYFDMWIEKAGESTINAIKKLSNTLQKHYQGIYNYVKHRLTNAKLERINGKIQTLKNVSRGYRSFESFRIAILFFNGSLDLYSHNSL